MTALNSAVANGHVAVVRTLLDYGTDPNLADQDGDVPLHICARLSGNAQTIQLLVDRRAHLNIRNAQGETPLQNAAAAGHTQVVEMLLRLGADVHS